MNASQQEDFLLRQVAGVAAALARILGLRQAGAADAARVELLRWKPRRGGVWIENTSETKAC